MNNSGTAVVLAALLLSVSVLFGSFVVKSSLDRGADVLASLQTGLKDMNSALKQVARIPIGSIRSTSRAARR
jgi:hypothetical protein